jgi:hypothetical protein
MLAFSAELESVRSGRSVRPLGRIIPLFGKTRATAQLAQKEK